MRWMASREGRCLGTLPASAAPMAPTRCGCAGTRKRFGIGGVEPAQHFLVERDAADDGGRLVEGLGAQERADEGAGHAAAKARPHGGLAVALLLAVDEIALGEDRAAGGDGGRLGDLPDQGRVVVGNAEARGLLVEERAGARRAHRVGGVVLEMPLGVELHQGDGAATDVDDVGGVGELGAHHRDLAGGQIQAAQLEGLAEAGGVRPAEADGVAGAHRQLGHGGLQRLGGLAAMPRVEGLHDLAVTAEPHGLERYRADVDPDSPWVILHTPFLGGRSREQRWASLLLESDVGASPWRATLYHGTRRKATPARKANDFGHL